ncbi:hypothetical protein FAM22021_001910 [Propionibacterium freudenreichii]|nr:hypothetical protein [Propionibacterium freudenreichii]
MGWRRHLGDDETVIADLRAHPKALVVPVVFLFALAAACGVALAMVPAAVEPWAGWLIAVITAGLAIAFVQRPVLAWATTPLWLHRPTARGARWAVATPPQ